MNWEEVSNELAKPLDPRHVKPPPQGKYGEYVEAHHVISEANRIFGFDGWSYKLDRLSLTNATMNGDKHRVGYMACVTVTIDGVTRGDVGHGQGFGKSEGDAHDSAVKEAVTDALKRSLRTFGNTFGLALYDKTKANVADPDAPPPFNSAAARDRIKTRVTKAKVLSHLQEIWTDEEETLKVLDEPHFNEIKKAFSDRKVELTPPDPAGQAPQEMANYG